MLQLDNIEVYYGKIHALKGVSLTVNDGELVALIGSNGAGKSTTLRTISGLLRPKQGRITYNGQRIDQLPSITAASRPASHSSSPIFAARAARIASPEAIGFVAMLVSRTEVSDGRRFGL